MELGDLDLNTNAPLHNKTERPYTSQSVKFTEPLITDLDDHVDAESHDTTIPYTAPVTPPSSHFAGICNFLYNYSLVIVVIIIISLFALYVYDKYFNNSQYIRYREPPKPLTPLTPLTPATKIPISKDDMKKYIITRATKIPKGTIVTTVSSEQESTPAKEKDTEAKCTLDGCTVEEDKLTEPQESPQESPQDQIEYNEEKITQEKQTSTVEELPDEPKEETSVFQKTKEMVEEFLDDDKKVKVE